MVEIAGKCLNNLGKDVPTFGMEPKSGTPSRYLPFLFDPLIFLSRGIAVTAKSLLFAQNAAKDDISVFHKTRSPPSQEPCWRHRRPGRWAWRELEH
jgi:hypothetical protein